MRNFRISLLLTLVGLLFAVRGVFAQTLTYFKPGTDPDGFRGIKWGQSFDSVIQEMEYIKTDPGNNDINIYKKKDDRLMIGDVELSKIEYYFWKNRFYKVIIYSEGFSNWKGLQEGTFERFGRGLQSESKKEEYSWFGNTRMILSYDESRKQGILTMFSREISTLQQEHDW